MADDYGNVILFASGIGIAAHLVYIKQLLNARDQGPTRTQVISLLWEVDEIEPWDAAIKMVHKLFDHRETPDWKNARSRFVSSIEVEEGGREEVVLHTYDFYPDA